MKKLLNYLWHLFCTFTLFSIYWRPYNGGASYSFDIVLFQVMIAEAKNSLSERSLFKFTAHRFYQWNRTRYDLDLFFIHVLSEGDEKI